MLAVITSIQIKVTPFDQNNSYVQWIDECEV